MQYINTETGEDDLSEAQVRAAFPNKSFAASDFPPAPYAQRLDTQQPAFEPLTQDVVRLPSVFENGVWKQAWGVVAVSVEVAAQRLIDAKEFAWERIKAKRDFLSDSGGYLVFGKWFHSDAKSKTQQLGLLRQADRIQATGGDMSAPFVGPGPGGVLYWKTMDSSFIPMTGTLAQAIFAAAEAQDMALFAVAEEHKAAMEASADPVAYDFSAGWPDTFLKG